MEKNDNSFKNSEEISARKTQEKLTQLIKDIEDEDVRWNAVVELGKIKDVRAAEALTKVLLDKSLIEIEDEAYFSLMKMGEIAVEPLIQAVKNKKWEIREKAADILANIGDLRAVEPLIQALEVDLKNSSCYKEMDTDMKVREVAEARAIKRICRREGEAGVEPLIKILKDKNRWKIHWMIEKILIEIGEAKKDF